MTPALILDILAVVMLGVAAVSAARLAAARPWRRGSVIVDADVAHLLMAIAMAGMLTPSLGTLPDTAWEAIFGVLIAWFAYRVVRDARANGVRALAGGHCAPHLVHSGSMLYMFLAIAAASAGGMAEMSGSSGGTTQKLSSPTLALAFALVLVGYTIWDLDQLSGRRYNVPSARVSLAGIGAAAVPAMAGAETVTAAFSGPQPAGAAVAGAAADVVPLRGAADSQDGPCDVGVAVGDAAGGALVEWLLSPAVTVGCRIAMGVAMAFMLLIAI